jgi:hypothetical protein
MGYLERNPLKRKYWPTVDKKIGSFTENWSHYNTEFSSTYHPGYNAVGLGGVGKSQSLRRSLDFYPQVIRHQNYLGENFTETQLVWLKLDCPYDGSTTGLVLNIFQTIDSILGTNYQKNYGKNRPDEMIASLSRVAANHHLGLLVIDEIQRLSLQKSGGEKKMLNFFVQIVNTIGVPVIMVGTFNAIPIFRGDFSQMRRGTGQGDIIWDRMNFDDEWKRFVKSMWKYELIRHPTPKDKIDYLARVLYEETQGIIDLLIKTFLFAQERAIDIGAEERIKNIDKHGERITPSIIRAVVRDKFQILRSALDGFKNGKNKALEK